MKDICRIKQVSSTRAAWVGHGSSALPRLLPRMLNRDMKLKWKPPSTPGVSPHEVYIAAHREGLILQLTYRSRLTPSVSTLR